MAACAHVTSVKGAASPVAQEGELVAVVEVRKKLESMKVGVKCYGKRVVHRKVKFARECNNKRARGLSALHH